MIDITRKVTTLAEHIHTRRADRARLLVSIAGAPGSGKSTLAEGLLQRLVQQKCAACVLPLDGFQLDSTLCEQRGLTARSGAPESYDAEGFVHLVARLRGGAEVVFPVYDRSRGISVAGAGSVGARIQVVILEGTYLLYDAAPWSGLAPQWDVSVRLHVPLPELRGRLIQRWLSQGLSKAAATRRAEVNDLPIATRIQAQARPADFLL